MRREYNAEPSVQQKHVQNPLKPMYPPPIELNKK